MVINEKLFNRCLKNFPLVIDFIKKCKIINFYNNNKRIVFLKINKDFENKSEVSY